MRPAERFSASSEPTTLNAGFSSFPKGILGPSSGGLVPPSQGALRRRAAHKRLHR